MEYYETIVMKTKPVKVYRSDLSSEDFDDAVKACAKSALSETIQNLKTAKMLSSEIRQVLKNAELDKNAIIDRFVSLEIALEDSNDKLKKWFK